MEVKRKEATIQQLLKESKEEEKKEETPRRREEAKPDPSVAAAKALSTSPAEAKPEAKEAPPSVTRRLKR